MGRKEKSARVAIQAMEIVRKEMEAKGIYFLDMSKNASSEIELLKRLRRSLLDHPEPAEQVAVYTNSGIMYLRRRNKEGPIDALVQDISTLKSGVKNGRNVIVAGMAYIFGATELIGDLTICGDVGICDAKIYALRGPMVISGRVHIKGVTIEALGEAALTGNVRITKNGKGGGPDNVNIVDNGGGSVYENLRITANED